MQQALTEYEELKGFISEIQDTREDLSSLRDGLKAVQIDFYTMDARLRTLDSIKTVLANIHDRLTTIEMFIKADSEEKVKEV